MTRPEEAAVHPDGALGDRYGRRDPAATRRRTIAAGLVFALLLLAWAVWAGLLRANADVRWQTGGFAAVDDGHATLEIAVTVDPGRTAVCTLRMLNAGLTEVGRLDVTVGPSTERTIRTVVTVPTFERAAGGNVRACAVR